ncbi:nicotinate-nucleotide adenylyltransferase [Limosilactobacillus equigenerosi]|uniref:Probable nicotinate-nucleotide adenylyltransferase n=1 Tax=Limosilactobacillus equigenerosi DSM 18793 = JCM 14505 TaxID=1423742 RepID=A0A0R1UFP4_9LACO|nr:nicotinate-nucleotide adenylyltransferase [Limosilactobacillus equigenerosi]KRL92223.1 putative nicotinate-nucleotide adenylyltransferase [Limosilactobacillus equigenerosi DSM 18793 = JCM 14505]
MLEEPTMTYTAQPQAQTIVATKRQRIGLYGGTFNPVHTAHLIMADQVGHTLGLDRVDLMPDAKPPHVDHKAAVAAEYRVAMLKLALADNPYLGLELTEIERGGVSYTYDTIKYLKEQHPENDYYFIIGGDMVDYLPKWYKIDELMKLVNFVAVRRPGAQNTTDYPVIWVDVPLLDISSSDIRARLQRGDSIHYLVPPVVEKYIKEHQLYLD